MTVTNATTSDMTQVLALLRAQKDVLRARGVASMAIFGSRARDDNRPDSDLDLLIESSRPFSLVDLVRVEGLLSSAVKLDVQITTKPSVPRTSRPLIEAESIMVF